VSTQPRPRGGLPFRTVQDYLEVPVRRRMLVLVPLVVVFVAAVVTSFVIPKRYRSSTLIFVESEKVPETFVPKMATESMTRRVQTVRQEVLSRTRLEQVVKDERPYPGALDNVSMSDAVEQMRGSITIQTKGTDSFLIEFVHNDPEKAASVANRLARVFIEEAEGQREKQAVEGYEFIDSQLKETRAVLESKEEAVRRFKEQNLGNLPEQLSTNVATLQRLQMELQTVSENFRAAQARADLLRQAAQQEANNPGVARVDVPSQLVQLRGQLAELRNRYTDQHPDVQALQRRIRELELSPAVILAPSSEPQPAGGSAASQLKRVELELDALRAKRAEVEAQVRRIEVRVDSAPRTEQQLVTMTRDYGQLQETYLSLLKKQMEARMAEQMERRWKGARFKILDPAHAPDRHYFPNRPLFALFGLLGGLALGLAVAFAAEILDHSVKSAEDLQEILPQPLLIVVPHISADQPRGAWSRLVPRTR
jgi:polysaccharide chain length determinant protein (PEP-CTERM system associated)